MNSVQTRIIATQSSEETVLRSNKTIDAAASSNSGSFHRCLQRAHQSRQEAAGSGNSQVKDNGQDNTSPARSAAEADQSPAPTTDAGENRSATSASKEDNTVPEETGEKKPEGDKPLNDSGQNPDGLVLLPIDIKAAAINQSGSNDETVQLTTPAALPDPVAASAPAEESLIPAAAQALMDAAPVSTDQPPAQKDVGTPADLGQTASQSPDLSAPVIQSSLPNTARRQAQNAAVQKTASELAAAELTAQSGNSTGTQPAGPVQDGEVKRIMDFESQRLNLSPVNGRGQKSADPETPAKSDDNGSLIAYVHRSQVEMPKNSLSETLNSQSASKENQVDPQDLMSQVVKKAELMLKQDSSEMSIQLKPDLLGKMTIKVSMENGVVTARFTTESQQVKNILDQNIQALRQTLEAQGVKVDKTEVNVQMDNNGMFGGFSGRQQELWQQQQQASSGAGVSGRIDGEVGELSQNLNQLPAYNQADNLYGTGSDVIDYRV